MSGPLAPNPLAAILAEKLRGRIDGPWDVYAERLHRYEVHLNGTEVEMLRGPIELEGFGLRVFRPVADGLGVGFASTSDVSDDGVRRALDEANATAAFARSPAKSITLPSANGTAVGGDVAIVDRRVWANPLEAVTEHARVLVDEFEDRPGTLLSFASIRATVGEMSIANSEGRSATYPATQVFREIAVKGVGGPEGAPPGEHWINQFARELDDASIGPDADRWSAAAEDVRHATATPGGPTRVVLPTSVLADVLPAILGFRFSGRAELRKMAPNSGDLVASEFATIRDDGLLPMAIGSAPVDDEGNPQGRRTLIRKGLVTGMLEDVVHASALGTSVTGNGRRDLVEFNPWFRFTQSPVPETSTIAVDPGEGGTDQELMEEAGDGIWIEQLGYAFPDEVSGDLGGEIRLGYRIRNGRRAEAVRGGTLGGSLISAVGDDTTFLRSIGAIGSRSTVVAHLSSPSILFSGIGVSGAT